MEEINADLIAAMASRIYNQGAQHQVLEERVLTQHDVSQHAASSLIPPHSFPGAIGPMIPSAVANHSASLPKRSTSLAGIEESLHKAALAAAHQSPPLHASGTTFPVQRGSPESIVQPPTAAFQSTSHATRRMEFAGLQGLPEKAALQSQSPPKDHIDHATASGLRVNSKLRPGSGHNGLQKFVDEVRNGGRQSNLPLNSLRLNREFHDDKLNRCLTSKPPIAPGAPSIAARDVHSIRSDFPALHQKVNGRPLVWFDNAATTQKPQAVIDAISHFYAHDNSNIHRAAHALAARASDGYEEARRRVANFIQADSEEIIWVRGATEGVNLIAQTLGRAYLRAGDEILLTTLEHHANIVPWQLVAQQVGAKIREVPVDDRGDILLSEYRAMLGPKTRVVAITQASNSLGTVTPVAEMTRLAHLHQAAVVVDGAQSIAHLPVNVRELECDFFVFSGHKIFAPMGIGAVYARREWMEHLPPWQGGGNMIKSVSFEETTFADPPAKFEAGTPSVADAIGLGVALDYVSRLGFDSILQHEHQLLEHALAKLARISRLRMLASPRERVSLVSFVIDGIETEVVGKELDKQGIAVRAGHHCAQPSLRRFGVSATVRPSFSIYNTLEEIDYLAEILTRMVSR